MSASSPEPPICTAGHSNQSLEALLALLRSHAVAGVADIRSFPGSRRHPHFAREALAAALAGAGLDYRWFPDLGGRRKPRPESPHVAWRVAGFRAYADYMETPEFEHALASLLAWARRRRAALLCAEKLWWQCHRRLLSDRLVTRGRTVLHLLSPERAETHRLTEFLRVDGERLVYDLALPLHDESETG